MAMSLKRRRKPKAVVIVMAVAKAFVSAGTFVTVERNRADMVVCRGM
jgi:hypothetical protein